MTTKADAIYPAPYHQVKEAIIALHENNVGKAKDVLRTLSEMLPRLYGTSEGTQVLFFIEAIRKRLAPGAPELGNLYLMPDQGQQIKMFNFMASKFPLVSFAQDIINTACVQEIWNEKTVTILDIGIGMGQQIANILERLSISGFDGEKITVIGIEPSETSLDKAQSTLRDIAQQKRLPLQFMAINETIETLMSHSGWTSFEQQLKQAEVGKLIVNASFALHHTQPISHRVSLFRNIKKLKPALLTMIEPYADFVTSRLVDRFDNAWHHYGLTFQAIDQIDASDEEKYLVKQIFFSREIQDVLSKNGHRIEQFETGEQWIKRLKTAGFNPDIPKTIPTNISNCPFVSVKTFPDYIGLCVDGYPIISIITACL